MKKLHEIETKMQINNVCLFQIIYIPKERANIDMGDPCLDMKPFMNVCIHDPRKLSETETVQTCLIPNYHHVQELRKEDAASSEQRTEDFTPDEREERELDTSPYVAFLQFITKVMVPHSTYTRYVLKKNLLIGDFVTTDDEALAFVIMDNCIEKWNFEYDIRKSKILEKIDEIVEERNRRSSGNGSSTAPQEIAIVSPLRGGSGNGSENRGNARDDRAPAGRTKKDLEQLKGILQKELITKEDKNLLPITKYTEQREEILKILVGWEGRGIKRFLEIKRNIKNFKEQNVATFQQIGAQSLHHMSEEMRGSNEQKNKRLTQYAKSEKELRRKRDIEEIYDEEDLSPFAGDDNMQVWAM